MVPLFSLVCILSSSVGDCAPGVSLESDRFHAAGIVGEPQGNLEDAAPGKTSMHVSAAVGENGKVLLQSKSKVMRHLHKGTDDTKSPASPSDKDMPATARQYDIDTQGYGSALPKTDLSKKKTIRRHGGMVVIAPELGVLQVPDSAYAPTISTTRGRYLWALGVVTGAVLLAAALFRWGAKVSHNQDETERLDDKKIFWATFVLGILNNTAYSIIMSASQPIAAIFGKEDSMEAFPILMVSACLATTLLNGTYFIQFLVRKRIKGIAIAAAVAFATLGVATRRTDTLGFSLALVAVVVVGCCQGLGELCCLSFLNAFPPNALGGWGAGTGFSGVAGTAAFLALTSGMGFSISEVSYLLIPTAPVYLWAYQYLETRLEKAAACQAEQRACEEKKDPAQTQSESEALSLQNLSDVWQCSGWIILYLVANYVLQYLIYPGLVDRDTLCPQGKNFIAQNAYTISWITSSIGCTIARASVAVFRIERSWILIAVQCVNVFFWFVEAISHTVIKTLGPVNGYVAILIWMGWVGALAGAGYGNCLHALGKRPDIPDSLRELSTTTAFALSNVGIIGSMAIFGILDNGMLSMANVFPEGCSL